MIEVSLELRIFSLVSFKYFIYKLFIYSFVASN